MACIYFFSAYTRVSKLFKVKSLRPSKGSIEMLKPCTDAISHILLLQFFFPLTAYELSFPVQHGSVTTVRF